MDELFTILIVVFALAKLFTKSKKKAANKQTLSSQTDTESIRTHTEGSAAPHRVAQPTVTVPKPNHQPAVPDRIAQLREKYSDRLSKGSGEGYSRPLEQSAELAPGLAGSMDYHSDEGRDICDPSLGHGESSLDQTGLPIFATHAENEPIFQAQDVVRGFVMSEILKRPTVNQWRR